MDDSRALVTYAQYNEDIILRALLYDVKQGYYVDVGANHPTRDSVTYLFYRQGWRGINIEPVNALYKQLAKHRKADVNLNCGVGRENGTLTLREYTEMPGHSTFMDSVKAEHDESKSYRDYDVSVRTLVDILREQSVRHVHFLKIDVEGFEHEVIEGNDWKTYRPEIVCVEANNIKQDWRKILAAHEYTLFIFDGLNEYYIAKEAWQRVEGFAERVVELDYRALKQHQYDAWKADSVQIKLLRGQLSQSLDQINVLNQQLHIMGRISLAGRSMPDRIKRSVYGLTIDWIRYRKGQRVSQD